MKKGHSTKKKKIVKPKKRLWVLAVSIVLIIVLGGVSLRSSFGEILCSVGACGRVASFLGVQSAESHFTLGEYFFTSSPQYDVRQAQHHYREATRIDPTLPGAHYQLGRTYFIVGRLEEAYAEILKEEELRPEFGKVHYMKGLIAGYMKNFRDAEYEFKKFIEFDSFNWAGYNDLSWIYFAQGNYHYAEATAREGLIHAAENPWLHNAVGVALLAQERPEEALPHLKKAQEGFDKLRPSDWGTSYPGNAPQEHVNGLDASRQAVQRNIERVRAQLDSVENDVTQIQ